MEARTSTLFHYPQYGYLKNYYPIYTFWSLTIFEAILFWELIHKISFHYFHFLVRCNTRHFVSGPFNAQAESQNSLKVKTEYCQKYRNTDKQNRFSTCFKTCGTGLLFKGCKDPLMPWLLRQ